MIEIVQCEMPIKATHREFRNSSGNFAVRIRVDYCNRVLRMLEISLVISMINIDPAPFIDDCGV